MKIDVKSKLKEMDIKLVDFAKELGISRPTLNSYIASFNNGDVISSEKHQLIFEKLFRDDIETKEEFNEVLDKYRHLIERDKVLGTIDLDVSRTDLITSIFERMKLDVKEKEYDEDIYTFINMLLRSYKNVESFRKLARYFLFLNGVKSIKDIEESEKTFISNCFRLMDLDIKNNLETDTKYFEKFLNRVSEIKTQNEEKSESKTEIIRKKIEEKIMEKINEQLKLGVDVDEVNIQKILVELRTEEN